MSPTATSPYMLMAAPLDHLSYKTQRRLKFLSEYDARQTKIIIA